MNFSSASFSDGGVLYHLVGYACKLRDVGGDRALRIYKCLEAVDYLHVIEFDRADFGYSVEVAAESGGLNIEYDHVAVYRGIRCSRKPGRPNRLRNTLPCRRLS